MTKVLLLGGSGFIGSNLAEKLIENNYEIIIFDIENANYANIKSIKNKIEIIKGNFTNTNLIEQVFKENKIDIVIHLITNILPISNLKNIEVDINSNLIATMKLLEIMNKYKTKKIIFFSSGGTVYGKNSKKISKEEDETNPINFYGWTKLSIEKYIQMFANLNDLEYLIVRPSNPYGKNQNIFGKQGLIAVTLGKIVKNEKIEIWGDGNIVRDYIYIDDLCDAVILLMKKNKWKEIYNIGSGKGLSIKEVVGIIGEVCNKKIEIEYKESRKVDIPVNILDISKLRNDIELSQTMDMKSAIKILWETLNKGVE